MSFLFGRKTVPNKTKKEKENKKNCSFDLVDYEIGSYQPNNPYRDLILLPHFNSIVRNICVLSDEKRLVVGDDDGSLTVWNENGELLANLKNHIGSITAIVEFSNEKSQSFIAVSSADRVLTTWDSQNYSLVKTVNFSSNICRLFMVIRFNSVDLLLSAGIDLRLYDSNLNVIDEIKRKKRENTIKHIIAVKEDRLIVATNSDLEIFGLVYSFDNETKSSSFKLKELKLHLNAHTDTILYLNKISDTMFGSSSANGILTLWHTDHLFKINDLKPFDELNKNESMLKQNLTCISCFKTFYERYLIVCSGAHISVYDFSINEFICKISNAHMSKITDLVILNFHLVTSSEDGSIRIWDFKESFYSNKINEEPTKTEIKLEFVGECLGHSSSVTLLNTFSRNEIISTGFDNLVIIWRNSFLIDKARKLKINKLLANIMG